MLCRKPLSIRGSRRGAAAVELAVLLPFLTFIFVAAVDFGRVFYYYITVTNCARNGAMYGSLDAAHSSNMTGIRDAALTDYSNISPTPSVTSSTGQDGSGNPFVAVTVSYPFKTFSNFPGIPSSASVSRTVQMRILPQ
jgi:Flp pilus assembly protein TadG